MKKFLRQLDDPTIDDNKIRFTNEFELVYLRHRYFRRSTNPTEARLAGFEDMICNISNKIYLRNIETFKTVGMEMEDLRNIARVHTVSFISMCGLAENPEKMAKFRIKNKKRNGPDSVIKDRDVFLKESYDLSIFLNQRLQEVSKVANSKNTNIRGTRSYKRFYLGDTSRSPTDLDLFDDPKAFGYKKITKANFKKLMKENNSKGKSSFITQDGKTVRVVYVKGSYLNQDDVDGTMLDPRNNFYYRTPEENILLKEMYKENK